MTATDPGVYEPQPTRQAPAAYVPAPTPLREPRAKSPALAAVLSLVPGLGQIYVGYYPRGFVHIVVAGGVISVLANMHEATFTPLLGMFLVFFWLYNVIDAARLAALYNQAMAGGREPDLPEGFKLPGMGGSILGGTVLILAGFTLLLHTRWGVRLDWVEEWWPAFPMLFGAYLVGKAVVERKRG
ncbi:MAG TPA: hypothetical protein VJS92_14640 [Candidatus Polarisedimenticolaceae bacterium]|nr:hypothetical protein [Candidatus Polarisedimenticolaceae bacterium]